jgi:hypothetical protein
MSPGPGGFYPYLPLAPQRVDTVFIEVKKPKKNVV